MAIKLASWEKKSYFLNLSIIIMGFNAFIFKVYTTNNACPNI